MDLKKCFTQRVNLLFGFGSLLPIVMAFAVIASSVFASLFNAWDGCAFWFLFVMPQTLYPILSGVIFLFAYKMLGLKVKDMVKREKSGALSYFIYIPMMIFISVLLANIVDIVFTFFRDIGIDLPTVSSSVPVPSSAVEMVALVFAMAILPALCEEFIYRLTFVGMLSPLSRGGAVLISSIAFGMMHGTLEQIFATFCMGIGLALIYNHTGNYRIPVVAHFINNLISCVFLVLYEYTPQSVYTVADTVFAITVFVCGLASIVGFLLIKPKLFSANPEQIKIGEALTLTFKAPMFWVFTVAYICITVANTVALTVLPS